MIIWKKKERNIYEKMDNKGRKKKEHIMKVRDDENKRTERKRMKKESRKKERMSLL